MYRRNILLLVFCALFVFVLTSCPNEAEEEVWLPYIWHEGTYEITQGYYRMVLENAGFVFLNRGANGWENKLKGWCETNWAATEFRFRYTDTWTNGAWQSFPYSEVYNYSYSNNSFTFSGDGQMRDTWVLQEPDSKPAQLVSTASYQETVDKLDEIITYCYNNPGPGNANNSLKLMAESRKTAIKLVQSNWGSEGSTHISFINSTIIDQLL